MSHLQLEGKLAVVTGAGSGIGAALSKTLAERGAHLALVDVNAEGLNATREAIRTNTRLSLHPMDVRDKMAVAQLPTDVEAAHGAGADILINNAGVALEGAFVHVSEENFDWVLDINLHAPIRLTRAFLPVLKSQPHGAIVNVSSVFGLIGPPGQTAYSTAKFGLRGFTESLRGELDGTSIDVIQVHPGGINTEIARSARTTTQFSEEELQARETQMQAFLKMPPADAAKVIADGMENGKTRILIGNDARAIDLIQRIAPKRYWSVLRKFFGG